MPYPLTPPPASDYGAFTTPRMLQRWLDVNPIGKLTRTQGFITLPAFSVAVTWNGYSDIVASFNFEGPNNFTLYGFNVEPTPTPNYCLCISWRTNGVMNRYSLWRGAGEVFYFPVTMYSGQKIGKNFRLEIWSTNSTPAVCVTPIVIYTSVLGGVDYRWGVDFTLVSNDPINTSFGCPIVIPSLVPPIGTFVDFIGAFGTGAQWKPAIDTFQSGSYIHSANTVSTNDPNIANQAYVYGLGTLSNPYTPNPSVFSAEYVVGLLINTSTFSEGEGVLATYQDTNPTGTDCGLKLHTADAGYGESTGYIQTYKTATSLATSPLLQSNTWYVVLFGYFYTLGLSFGHAIPLSTTVIPTFAGYNFTTITAPSLFNNMNSISNSYTYQGSGAFSSQLNYAEILGVAYSSGIEQAIINYFFTKYKYAFQFPITFPAGAISTTN